MPSENNSSPLLEDSRVVYAFEIYRALRMVMRACPVEMLTPHEKDFLQSVLNKVTPPHDLSEDVAELNYSLEMLKKRVDRFGLRVEAFLNKKDLP